MTPITICLGIPTASVIDLPGSECAVRESLAYLVRVLQHAARTAGGRYGDHL